MKLLDLPPLPASLEDFSKEMLLTMVRTLHQTASMLTLHIGSIDERIRLYEERVTRLEKR